MRIILPLLLSLLGVNYANSFALCSLCDLLHRLDLNWALSFHIPPCDQALPRHSRDLEWEGQYFAPPDTPFRTHFNFCFYPIFIKNIVCVVFGAAMRFKTHLGKVDFVICLFCVCVTNATCNKQEYLVYIAF